MNIKLDKIEKQSVNTPMWTVFGSRMFFSLVGIAAVFFYIAPLIASILTNASIPFHVSFYIICISITIYALFRLIKTIKEDIPSHWTQDVEIDFNKKELTINLDTYGFHEIYRVVANQYESDLFPSFYKIWIEFEKGRRIKFLSLKEVDAYTYILKRFHEAGIPVN